MNGERENTVQLLHDCRLCPRECGADRVLGKKGVCRMGARACVSRASLHMWEEPCISGNTGSGTVFFSGCSLGCVYCQNAEIALGKPSDAAVIEVSEEQLARIFLSLQKRGAENINLVTAGHFVICVKEALIIAKEQGLYIPVVYNSSGYEKPESLRILDGLVDIYLPDFKYISPELAWKYSRAADYPEWAKRSLEEMVRQAGQAVFDDRGMMRKGVIVRVLLLPGHVKEACAIVDYLHCTYGEDIYISLMSQYTPMPAMREDPLLGRRVTKREYEKLVQHALDAGVVNGFLQEGESAEESFIPSFRGEGVSDLWDQDQ